MQRSSPQRSIGSRVSSSRFRRLGLGKDVMPVLLSQSQKFMASTALILSVLAILLVVAMRTTPCANAASGSCSVGDLEVFTSAITVNEDGNDADTRFEGDTDQNLFYLDAGNDRIGLGTSAPSVFFDVRGISSFGDNNITNVADIALDTISADATNINVAINGIFGIAETVNTKMVQGITINQGGEDDEILALKSSDVAHPFTGILEADTYGKFNKINAAIGGTQIVGASSAASHLAFLIQAYSGDATPDTTDDSNTRGIVDIQSWITDGGTSVASPGANDAIFTIASAAATRFLVKGDGDIHVTNTTLIALDEHDDIGLIRDLRLCMAKGNDTALNARYGNNGNPVHNTCPELVDLGLLSNDPIDESATPLYNLTSTSLLVMDALRTYAEATDLRLADLEARLVALGG